MRRTVRRNMPQSLFLLKTDKNTFIDEMKNINTAHKTKSVMNTFDSFVYKTLNTESVQIEKLGHYNIT
jgi:hypothetical protein